MKLLIVEDEVKTAAYLRKGLGENGFVVDVADNGPDAIRLAGEIAYELIILDVMLPGQDGWSVLGELRRGGSQTPVLFLTARDTVEDRVRGLELGADDYLVKPFAFSELLGKLLSERELDSPEIKWEVELEYSPQHLSQVFIRVMDQRGRVILCTPGMADRLPASLFPPATPAESLPGTGVDARSRDGEPFRLLAREVSAGKLENEPLTVQMALDTKSDQQLLMAYRRRLWLILGIAFGACCLTGYLIARQGLRPIEEATATARRIGSATLHERMATAGLPTELLSLAGTFNEMLDRLQEAFARISRFSADIAHELRTPINNLRGEVEVSLGKARTQEEYRDVLSSCLEECSDVSRLIDSLLFLARADHAEMHIRRDRLDVGQELAAVADFYDAAASEAGVEIVRAWPDGLSADLDRPLFQRAIGNLIENALAHTPGGGTLALRAERHESSIRIEVNDTGQGIPAEHLARVFDRFHRVDASRSKNRGGAGLGLAIVRSIALLHGGSVTMSSQLGQGTCVTIAFPANAPCQSTTPRHDRPALEHEQTLM